MESANFLSYFSFLRKVTRARSLVVKNSSDGRESLLQNLYGRARLSLISVSGKMLVKSDVSVDYAGR